MVLGSGDAARGDVGGVRWCWVVMKMGTTALLHLGGRCVQALGAFGGVLSCHFRRAELSDLQTAIDAGFEQCLGNKSMLLLTVH